MAAVSKFVIVGDVAVNADPIHAGLPWACIRIFLQMAINDSEVYAAFLQGTALVTHLVAYYASVEDLYIHKMVFSTKENIELLKIALVELYTGILDFLQRAFSYYKPGSTSHRVKSFAKNVFSAGANGIQSIIDTVTRSQNTVDRILKIVKDENDLARQQQSEKGAASANQTLQQLESKLDGLQNIGLDQLTDIEGFLYRYSIRSTTYQERSF